MDYRKGEWVAFVDSDDFISNDYLYKLYQSVTNKHNKSPFELQLSYCKVNMFSCDDNITYTPLCWCNSDKIASLQAYIASTWTVCWEMIIHHSLLSDLRFSEDIKCFEDFSFCAKLFHQTAKITAIHEPLYNYRRGNQDSLSYHIDSEKGYSELLAYLDVIRYFEEKGELSHYEKQMSWRILKAKQDWILDLATHKKSYRLIRLAEIIFGRAQIRMWALS